MKKMNEMDLTPSEGKGRKGKQIKYRVNDKISVSLETFDTKNPALLWMDLCFTLPSTFDTELTIRDWNRDWGQTRIQMNKLFRELICPDENIFNLQFPDTNAGLGDKPNRKTYICLGVTFNNDREDWTESYTEVIEEFSTKMMEVLMKKTGFETCIDEE